MPFYQSYPLSYLSKRALLDCFYFKFHIKILYQKTNKRIKSLKTESEACIWPLNPPTLLVDKKTLITLPSMGSFSFSAKFKTFLPLWERCGTRGTYLGRIVKRKDIR